MKRTVFDDVFRTICERMPSLLVPLINESFDTNYSDKTKIKLVHNEHHLGEGVVITDAVVEIKSKRYHIECQSTDTNQMILRMFEYDSVLAIESAKKTSFGYEINFPGSCVVYIRGKNRNGRKKTIKVNFPDGRSYDYAVKVIEIQKYTADEIFRKNLLMMLPFYILRYENKLPTGKKSDNKKMQEFLKEYENIVKRLGEGLLPKRSEEYTRLVELIIKISDHICGRSVLKERMRGIMGGKVLVMQIDKVKAAAEAEGMEKGMQQGMQQGTVKTLHELVNEGIISVSDAAKRAGMSVKTFKYEANKIK